MNKFLLCSYIDIKATKNVQQTAKTHYIYYNS